MVEEIRKIEEEYKEYKEIFFGSGTKYYEKLAKFVHNILKLKTGDIKKIEEFENINKEIHLDLNYDQVYSLSIFSLLVFSFTGVIFFLLSANSLLLLFFLICGLLMYFLVLYYPKYLYNSLKSKKREQLILAILFMAMKLRENPNLETAFLYTTKYIQPPLRLDFLKLLWDTYNKKYSSLKEAISYYLKNWEEDAYYFVIGMELLISSLYESDPIRRENIIDKAVEESLNNLLESLSLYVRELQSPINLIYMLGIVLPTLLLTLFPLVSVLMSDVFSPSFLFVFFDIAIPFFVFLLTKQYIESKRKETIQREDIYFYLYLKKNNRKFIVLSVLFASLLIVFLFFIIVFIIKNFLMEFSLLSILLSGIFVLLLSLAMVFSSYFYYHFYENFDKRLDNIDKDMSSFLFSLGNVLGEEVPLELALIKIYSRFKDKPIGSFISEVYKNLKVGLSLEEAIFDREKGALIKYPSAYLEAAMEVIVESSKVSPISAGKAAIAISRYFLYMEKVRLRLLDLTAEVTSQMKSLAKILAPSILGIVVAIALMSLNILYKLGIAIANIKQTFVPTSTADIITYVPLEIIDLLSFSGNDVSPATIFIIVGLFNLLITILLSYILNLIENGRNPIKEKKYIYSNLFLSSILFFIIATFGSILLWSIADNLLNFIT